MANDGSSGTSSPTLNNVVFSGNSANFGGGMYNDGEAAGVSNPTLTNVTFVGNSASQWGGGLYNDGYAGTSSPTLTAVTFSANAASAYGGAMLDVTQQVGRHPRLLLQGQQHPRVGEERRAAVRREGAQRYDIESA